MEADDGAKRFTRFDGDVLVLPRFELLARQPDPPHVAHVIARADVPNAHGVAITITLRESRKRNTWWISSSLKGMRMSNTVRTTRAELARRWLEAVRAGRLRVESTIGGEL